MLAFTFPGQGSQKPGMGAPWVEHESWELVEEASKCAGRDIARLLLEADAEELRQTSAAATITRSRNRRRTSPQARRLPAGSRVPPGAPGGIRTHTVRILRPPSLPVGVRERFV